MMYSPTEHTFLTVLHEVPSHQDVVSHWQVELPGTDVLPVAQGKHEVDPADAENVLARQFEQRPFWASLYVPAGQGVQADAMEILLIVVPLTYE
jgi:hypothetical protein